MKEHTKAGREKLSPPSLLTMGLVGNEHPGLLSTRTLGFQSVLQIVPLIEVHENHLSLFQPQKSQLMQMWEMTLTRRSRVLQIGCEFFCRWLNSWISSQELQMTLVVLGREGGRVYPMTLLCSVTHGSTWHGLGLAKSAKSHIPSSLHQAAIKFHLVFTFWNWSSPYK